ncbi:MAG: hypothetical protein QM754_14490 [Tepidisphaeraceae bacterium]
MAAIVRLDTHHHVGAVDRRIFGGFAEHLGRCIYEGIYDPGNAHGLIDEDGFRTDVIAALKPLGMPVMRYPGGNFVSCYDWRDGIGPREKRPVRRDFAWHTLESNQFGTDEFMAWCKKLGTAPMMAVNLGTAGAAEAAALIEYCNLETGSAWADLRKTHGHAEPYGVKLWCLGNEMDGPWQAGHVPATEYGQRARAAGAMLKGLDSTIETIACGSSAPAWRLISNTTAKRSISRGTASITFPPTATATTFRMIRRGTSPRAWRSTACWKTTPAC